MKIQIMKNDWKEQELKKVLFPAFEIFGLK